MPSQLERIVSLETIVADMRAEQKLTNEKLDELLALRNKGAGVFWFVSVIFGTGVLGIASFVVDWFRG